MQRHQTKIKQNMKIHGTTKGGALSTKDFGVAFGGNGVPASELLWENLTATGFANNHNYYNGLQFGSSNSDVQGKHVTSIVMKIRRVGLPSGTMQGMYWNNDSSTSADQETNTIDMSVLSTSYTEQTFTFDGDHEVEDTTSIGLKFSSLVNASYCQMYKHESSAVDDSYIFLGDDDDATAFTYPASSNRCLWFKVYGYEL